MITADAISDGLARGEFFLEYLPTVSLADGRCMGAEALARWRRSSGVVQPEEFIHTIEGTHLSGALTYWVLETVAKELGDWLRINNDVHIGVNVPPEILGRGGLEYAAGKPGCPTSGIRSSSRSPSGAFQTTRASPPSRPRPGPASGLLSTT
jgi:Predicted signal transduction protein containing sensor and EAL domains